MAQRVWRWSGVVGLGLVVACGICHAEEATAAPAASAQDELTRRQEALKAWQEKLTGTMWALEVRARQGSGKTTQDTLTLKDDELISEAFSKAGFHSSSYTVTPLDDGAATVETMQMHPDGDKAFWRAEVRGETIQGVIVKHSKKGAAEELTFVGKPAQTSSAPAPAESGEDLDSKSTGQVGLN